MPELLLQETNPYATRRASLLRGEGDLYLYLEDIVSGTPETTSAVWVANVAPAPTDGRWVAPEGTPPRMGAGGTRHPEGCPAPDKALRIVWFEEGDAVALLDGEGVLAAIPGWGGRNDFYGYARYARGRCPLAWELTREADEALQAKARDSEDFWAWRTGNAWPEISSTGMAHLEQNVGPQEALWPIAGATFPEIVASQHRIPNSNTWVTATTGLSAQRMAGVEQYVDEPSRSARIELAIARHTPDQSGAELLGALATVPFGRCTWLGEGHTIGGTPGVYPAFGPDKAALLLTSSPPPSPGNPMPDLQGLVRRGDPVTYLWVMVVDEETFRIARGRDARTAMQHLVATGATWIQ